MKWIGWIFCVALMAGVAGCVPERVVWSPDGTRAAVLGQDGLHVCDGEGKIGPALLPGVNVVEWMKDGKGVVVNQDVELKSWKEIEEAFPEAYVVAKNPEGLNAVRAALLSFDGDWSNVTGELMKKVNQDDRQLKWNLIYLRDHEEEALKAKLGEHWEAIAGMTWEAAVVRTYGISGNGASASEGPVLMHLVRSGEKELRVSPDGRNVAVTVSDEKEDHTALTVAALDGKGGELGLGEASLYCDWSADGKYVVYCRPTGEAKMSGNQARFGTLSRQQVAGADGKLLSDKEVPAAEDLVGMLYDSMLRVRVAKDGRIYFVSAEVNLPVSVLDVDPKAQLYCVDPARPATVERVVPRSQLASLGDAPEFFELSPDGMRMSVPFGDGRVSVVELTSGNVEMVQAERIGQANQTNLTSVPTWRSATELTFVRPAGEGKQEVVLYSMADKSVKVLSAGWPREVVEDWLVKKEDGSGTKP